MVRATLKSRRAAFNREQLASIDESVFRRLLRQPEVYRARSVFCFVGVPGLGEPDTLPLIEELRSKGVLVGVPVVTSHGGSEQPAMEARVFEGRDGLVPNRWGLLEPQTEALSADAFDLAIVPALGVSPVGHRIGFGKGFYDRYLQNFRGFAVCPCRQFAIVPPFSSEPTDVPMDMIVTERAVVRIV